MMQVQIWSCDFRNCQVSVLEEEDRSGHPSTSNMFMTHADEMVQADSHALLKKLLLAFSLM
jgi:hypothetical protein